VGLAQVRMPPQLRPRHRALRPQEDQADGPADRVPRSRGPPRGRAGDHRLGAGPRRHAGGARPRTPQALRPGGRAKKIGESEGDAAEFEWRALFVAGMWFQDLFNYDFRRTEMCIIPYGTQMGEISFCAYNTGVGWRNVIEKMKANATTAEWYREKGRHPVYAKGQELPLPEP